MKSLLAVSESLRDLFQALSADHHAISDVQSRKQEVNAL